MAKAKKASNIALWIVMVLLIIGLAGFGATNFGGSAGRVASVGGVDISAREYATSLRNQLTAFERQTGQSLSIQQAQQLGLTQIAMSNVISEAALAQAASEAGVSVGDVTVAETITNRREFQGADGFDRATYENALQRSGLSVREFEQNVREDIAADIFRQAITSGIKTPSTFSRTLFEYARQERDVTWARLTADDLSAEIAEPSDDELRAYYEANQEPFTRPETREIVYASLTPDMVAPAIEVSDDEIQAAYDARISEYVQPERRLVERLIYPTEEAAAEADARLQSGEVTFDELVAERGLTLSDIDLGDVSQGELGGAGDAIFALEEPGVTGPLPSDLGPAIYRMNAILAAQEITIDEARTGLRDEIALERAGRAIDDQIGRIEDLLAGGADLATIAERTDMQIDDLSWTIDVVDGIASDPAFRQAAQTTEPGAFPELEQLENGGVFVLTVEEVLPPALRPLDEVREDVVTAWTTAETEKALAARAEEIASEIREGAEMAALGLTLKTDRNISRNGFVEGTPPGFNEAIFELETDGVAVLSADGDAWIARLDAVTIPDVTSPENQLLLSEFDARTASGIALSIALSTTNAILSETEVQIDSAALAAVEASLY